MSTDAIRRGHKLISESDPVSANALAAPASTPGASSSRAESRNTSIDGHGQPGARPEHSSSSRYPVLDFPQPLQPSLPHKPDTSNDKDSQKERKKHRKKKTKSALVESTGADAFFLDTSRAMEDDTDADPSNVTASNPPPSTSAAAALGLLLPDHVFLFESTTSRNDLSNGDNILLPSSPALSITSDIQFIDDDKPALRYFQVQESNHKTSARLCSNCGEPGHLARACKVKVCWVCGTKNDHESRECPVSMVCWNCGRRGHQSSACPEPRSRRGCRICGSDQHVSGSCPLHWRRYHHMTESEREESLDHRASKIGLPLGEGGEGFISWNAECFCCGQSGHWGFDCSSLPSFLRQKEPPSFSAYHADHGPWPFNDRNRDDDYRRRDYQRSSEGRNGRNNESNRVSESIYNLEQASSGLSGGLWQEPDAWSAGRLGKERAIQRARKKEAAPVEYVEGEDDEDDWFNNQKSGKGKGRERERERGKASKNDSHRSRSGKGKKTELAAEAINEVSAWFSHDIAAGSSSSQAQAQSQSQSHGVGQQKGSGSTSRSNAPTEDDREEQEFLAYQQVHAGRYEEAEDHGVRPRSRRKRSRHGASDRDRDRDREGEQVQGQEQDDAGTTSRRQENQRREASPPRSNGNGSRSRQDRDRAHYSRTPHHSGARDRREDDVDASLFLPPKPSTLPPKPQIKINIRGAGFEGGGGGGGAAGGAAGEPTTAGSSSSRRSNTNDYPARSNGRDRDYPRSSTNGRGRDSRSDERNSNSLAGRLSRTNANANANASANGSVGEPGREWLKNRKREDDSSDRYSLLRRMQQQNGTGRDSQVDLNPNSNPNSNSRFGPKWRGGYSR